MTTEAPARRAGPVSTTVYEVRYTSPREWVAEAQADIDRGRIQDSIVRLAVRKGTARVRDIHPERYDDDRSNPWWQSYYVEATYLTTSGQLVKLSAYCGVVFVGPEAHAHGDLQANASRETAQKVQSVVREIQAGIAKLEGADIRGGQLVVEEGAWQAGTVNTIEAPADLTCATCGTAIYWSNEEWRHKLEGREARVGVDSGLPFVQVIAVNGRAAAVAETPCPDCHGEPRKPDPKRPGATINCRTCATSPGVRRVEHHLADPEIEGRTL